MPMASRHQNQEEDRSAGDRYLDFDSFAAASADFALADIHCFAELAAAAVAAAGLVAAGILAAAAYRQAYASR